MTDDQIREIWLQETGYAEEAAPFAILDFARALLATTAPTVEDVSERVYWSEPIRSTAPAVEKEASPVATGDRLTDTKVNDIIARDGYKWTGVVLMNEHGDRCIVELSAVRWLNKEAMWRLMHPDASPTMGDSAGEPYAWLFDHEEDGKYWYPADNPQPLGTPVYLHHPAQTADVPPAPIQITPFNAEDYLGDPEVRAAYGDNIRKESHD